MQQLQRTMKSRHLFMLALGGVIGSGLFLSSGYVIQQAGPGGAILAYLVGGLIMYLTMLTLGELSVANPDSGSFQSYATKLINPATGYVVGWMYWLNWAMTIGIELTSIAILMKRWFPTVDAWIWCVVFALFLFAINILSTRSFAETEFWFSSVKVIVIVLFLALGSAAMFGLIPMQDGSAAPQLSNLTAHGGLIPNGWVAILVAMMSVAFSFQGAEVIGLTSGESVDPQKTVPRAVRQTIWRTLFFYVFSIIVLVSLIPWQQYGVIESPFVAVFDKIGIPYAADIMNFVILTAFVSVANSGIYACSRMLYSMSQNGISSPYFGKLSKKGVPVNGIVFSLVIAGLSLFTSVWAPETVYVALLSLASFAGVFVWMMIGVCGFLFRKRFIANGGKIEQLKYRTRFFPLVPVLTIVLNLIVLISLAIRSDQRIAVYIGIPSIIFLYFFYHIKERVQTKFFSKKGITSLNQD